MATTETKNTKDQVRDLMDKGLEAKDIAKALGKTQATVYVHIRHINTERGVPSRGRGRPPKVQTGGNGNKPQATTRKAPPRAGQKTQAKAQDQTQATGAKRRGRPPGSGKATTKAAANNGHVGAEFPAIKSAVETELGQARRRVTMLEGMLATLES